MLALRASGSLLLDRCMYIAWLSGSHGLRTVPLVLHGLPRARLASGRGAESTIARPVSTTLTPREVVTSDFPCEKTNAERLLKNSKSQYSRAEYLQILTTAASLARPDMLALTNGGACTGDCLLQAVASVLGSTSSNMKDLLLKQLLANEISFTAGFQMTYWQYQLDLIRLAENVVAAGRDTARMSELQVYLDKINNLPN